ncbi:hypothetical protein ACQPXM_32785 [Kribbella sp. CA-253562]|uniref:hypothetical protein n=1 Tax=Kribbella sp. CA-253562 TaxID=3239942 RepID=UPI003D8AA94D
MADIFSEDDDALLDIYVFGTTWQDWDKAIAAVRSQGWPVGFNSTGRPLPPDVREIFALTDELSVSLSIHPVAALRIPTHFFAEDEIEFDLSPTDVRGQVELDALCTFLRVVARAVDKPIVLTPESLPAQHLLAYDPATDAFAVGVS